MSGLTTRAAPAPGRSHELEPQHLFARRGAHGAHVARLLHQRFSVRLRDPGQPDLKCDLQSEASIRAKPESHGCLVACTAASGGNAGPSCERAPASEARKLAEYAAARS